MRSTAPFGWRRRCACAAIQGLVVLHYDNDVVAAARHLPDLVERRVQPLPEIA